MVYALGSARWRLLALVATGAILGCGAHGDAAVAKVPARSGDVWEVDRPEDRATAPGAFAAFVSGAHVMVIDGDEAFTGSSSAQMERAADGSRTLKLPDGSAAQVVAAGDALELRFDGGAHTALRKQPPRKEASR